MFDALYRFLISHKKISLPGIGTLVLQVKPAQLQFVDHSFLPPQYFFVLEKEEASSSRKIFTWLAAALHISEREAVIKLNDFVFDIKKQLNENKKIAWPGVGSFKKTIAGDINFESENKKLDFLTPVMAEKVTRENAEHAVVVGDREMTSTEMSEFFSGEMEVKEKSSYVWIWPAALIFLMLIFLGWYFSEHGMKVSSTGNIQKISPANPAPGFYFIP